MDSATPYLIAISCCLLGLLTSSVFVAALALNSRSDRDLEEYREQHSQDKTTPNPPDFPR